MLWCFFETDWDESELVFLYSNLKKQIPLWTTKVIFPNLQSKNRRRPSGSWDLIIFLGAFCRGSLPLQLLLHKMNGEKYAEILEKTVF